MIAQHIGQDEHINPVPFDGRVVNVTVSVPAQHITNSVQHISKL